MKLRDYMRQTEEGAEVTCWDKDVDSEFYFYNDPADNSDPDFVNYETYMQRMIDTLDVVKIHDRGVEVNLYELLENPDVVAFAKERLYDERQYESDEDVVMLLFDDNVTNISQGYDNFSKEMLSCLDKAYGPSLDEILADAQARSDSDRKKRAAPDEKDQKEKADEIVELERE